MANNKLIQELQLCINTCNMCYNACLNEEDVTMMARCIELDRECADICQLTASVLGRESENAERYLSLCSEICHLCGEECGKHDNEHCQNCSRVCKACAEACASAAAA